MDWLKNELVERAGWSEQEDYNRNNRAIVEAASQSSKQETAVGTTGPQLKKHTAHDPPRRNLLPNVGGM